MIDTFRGVWLALAGGMLPAAIFILKDFTDSIPRSYEESAQGVRGVAVPGDPAHRASRDPTRAWP